jgi:hypothetical protein
MLLKSSEAAGSRVWEARFHKLLNLNIYESDSDYEIVLSWGCFWMLAVRIS